MMRTAISPRLAMRTFFNWILATILASQRIVSVFFGGIPVALVLEILERRDQLPPRLPRMDHLVHEAAPRRNVRVRELRPELRHLLGARLHRIVGRVQLPLI